MDVFLLFHNEREEDRVTYDLIGAYSTLERATKNYHFYLDTLEKGYREDEQPSKDNTFNRFGEPQQDKILCATLERDGCINSVFISMREVD